MQVNVIINGQVVGTDNINIDASVSITQEINEAIKRAAEKYEVQVGEIGIQIGHVIHNYYRYPS